MRSMKRPRAQCCITTKKDPHEAGQTLLGEAAGGGWRPSRMQHVRSTRTPQRQAVSVIAKIKNGAMAQADPFHGSAGLPCAAPRHHDFIPCSGLRHTASPFGVYSWLQQQDLNL